MRFSAEDVQRFADWSADRNPLHVDQDFARQTHFGRPIVHGVLTVLEALQDAIGRFPERVLVKALDIEFRNAVVCGEEYETRCQQDERDLLVTLHAAGQLVLSIRAEVGQLDGEAGTTVWTRPEIRDSALRNVPVVRTVDELERSVEASGVYPMRLPDRSAVTGALTDTQTRVLALCSYITGMELPGLRSLFTRITVRFHAASDDAPELHFRARTTRFDRQFRLLDTELEVAAPSGTAVATVLLRSYVPFSPAFPNLPELAAGVTDERANLHDKVALVIGGTRGLGAAVAAGLALGGSHVYASSRQSDGDQVWTRDLRARGGRLEFLQGDAADPEWCEATLELLRSRHRRLDVLVLNACAPPGVLRFGRDSASKHAAYVRDNLQLVETPLATFAAMLEESGGRVVCVSSSFAENPPAGFGHYVAVKQAAEGLVRTVCRERPRISGVIVRPPVLQTRWNDTPSSVIGAMPTDVAALHIVRAVAHDAGAGGVTLVREFPTVVRSDVPETSPAHPPDYAIRVAATFTVDPLLPSIRFWTKELDLNAALDPAPYGQVIQSLLDPASPLNAKGRGINIVFLRVRDWLRELAEEQAGDIEYVRTYLHETARDFERALRAHRAHASAETLMVVCPSHGTLSAAESILLRQTEMDIVSTDLPGLEVIFASEYHNQYSVDEDQVYDELRDEIAHIPYRDEYLCVLATIAARHLHRHLTAPRKVVVVDCDNTLWRGVVGEVGPDGVEFDNGHRALHATLARLAQSGVLVCLCSKNEEADVWRVFATHTDLLLRREHIVAAVINWLPKSQNIRTLATRLNLGLDSFVFVDDNPVECAEVQAGCPEVLAIQWPQDGARAEQLLQHIWEFDPRTNTKEDERRTEMYRQEFRRQEARAETFTFEDFITNLQLVVDVSPLAADDLRRAAQLTLRTNQFNFTTIRRDEAEVQALMASGRHEIQTVRVRDRFGDYGLVGLIVVERGEQSWAVDTLLLSCRVLGRGVEHRLIAELGQRALGAGAKAVKLRVQTTKRNTPARSFVQSIIPAEFIQASEQGIECDVPSDVLAAIRFEPSTAGEVAVQEDGGGKTSTEALNVHALRRREAQIMRVAFELASGAELRAAMEGRAPSAPRALPASGDVTTAVIDAFARALRLSPDRVVQVDHLEPLGCDSLRIVEITVALSEKFPWLPSTLLFEHRSVSEIVREVTRLSQEAHEVVSVVTIPVSSPTDRRESPPTTDVAVVGMHVRCAGAQSPDELWDLLSAGQSAVKPVPEDRPHFLHRLSDSRPHWAGLLDQPAQFDAEFFGVSPREAEFMDPQLRLFLEVAWGALEDAGCAGADHDADTGVFAGVMYGDYGFRANIGSSGAPNPYRCWEGFSLANRLSQLLGFHGPSLAVDTACSSSGTALHLACRALNAGECNAAIVGGVNLILDPDRFASLGRLGILSNRGRCEPFGADADGTVLGEGAGVVVLRRLDDALERGERIYGVIKGSGLSTGSGTVGFTAPNPQAQAVAIRRALKAARVDPRTISYVETHGTGTALGDPIEVRGLTLGYGTSELQDPAVSLTHRATIGSIKPNIGHLEAGAGVLGLIKVLLQLHRGKLLPSITSALPNAQIPFAQGPFDVQRVVADWQRPTMQVNGSTTVVPRRAGLSSFGVGGANAHVIVEEAPDRVAVSEPPDRPLHVVALSARNGAALQQQATELRQYLEHERDTQVSDVCYSVNTGRKHFEHRLAATASNREDLLRTLREIEQGASPRGTVRGVVAAGSPKVAFLFTGQGSQYAGMGRQLYESQLMFRTALDRCAAIFDKLLNRPLLELLFAEEGSADAELLNQTGYTQPALFAFEYAVSELWKSWGIVPDVVLGHSVGEISAMCVAGGITLEDGLKLIAARGRLMQALPSGGVMASVMADETRVLKAIAGAEDSVAIAAINAPGQIVISGAGVAVAEIAARLTADGIKTKSLVVSHAFHSPLMKPMLAEYERVVREVRFSPPLVAFVSCVDGVLAGDELTRVEYWLRNVMEPVRFAAGVKTLEAEQVTAYVEVGPQPVLLGMARQSVSDDTAVGWLPSVRKDVDSWQTILGSVGTLYTRGAAIDWKGFDQPYSRTRVSVPRYPFARKDYWLRHVPTPVSRPSHIRDAESSTDGTGSPLPLYELVWRKAAQAAPENAVQHGRRWLIVPDRGGVGHQLAIQLAAKGAAGTLLDPVGLDQLSLVEQLQKHESAGERSVVDLRGLDGVPAESLVSARIEDELGGSVTAAVELMQIVAKLSVANAKLWVVTSNAVGPIGADDPSGSIRLTSAPLWGLARTFALEHPERWGGLIDVALDDPSAMARALAAELMGTDDEDQVALRTSGRHVARLAQIPPRQAELIALSPDATYLVTGGVGALGLHVGRWLVAAGARRLLLASRGGGGTDRARAAVSELESLGASVSVVACDVSRAEDVQRLINGISADAPLRGVVHAAAVDSAMPIEEMSGAEVATALAGKAIGGWLLHQHTRALNLDLFLCFSSMSSLFGANGRGHYSAANAFLDALAMERRRLGLPASVINWGPWKGGGMASATDLQQFAAIGNRGLDPAAAVAALGEAVARGDTQLMVADVDWPLFRTVYEARRPRPILAECVSPSAHTQAAKGQAAVAPWVDRLKAAAPSERVAQLSSLLREEVADTLGFESAASVPFDRNFYEMGMDSLMMADLVGRLKERVGVSCTGLVFNYPNVNALAERMLERLPLEPGEIAVVTETASAESREISTTAAPDASQIDPATEVEIRAFQSRAFPDRRADWVAPRWRWMFIESAARLGVKPQFWVHRENGAIVGQMGSIPVRLKLGEECLNTGWLVETMVLQEYRSQAVGSRLMVDAHEDQPFSLSLGQTPEMREIQFRLGWRQVAPLETAQLLVRPGNVLKGKVPTPAAWAADLGLRASSVLRDLVTERPKMRATPIDRFDERHDVLWAAASRDLQCAVVRDASYLNWKYVDQPGQQFLRLEVCDDSGIRGIAVWGFREPDANYRYRRGLLVDLVAPLSDAAALQHIIKASCAAATDQGADALICHHVGGRLTQALRACGFHLRRPERFFLVDPGPLADPLLARVLAPDNWLITHGDSDIDRPW